MAVWLDRNRGALPSWLTRMVGKSNRTTAAYGEAAVGDKKLISAHMNDAQQQMRAQQHRATVILALSGESCRPVCRAKLSPGLDLIRAAAGKDWLYSG